MQFCSFDPLASLFATIYIPADPTAAMDGLIRCRCETRAAGRLQINSIPGNLHRISLPE
jgi:hypothetical protein